MVKRHESFEGLYISINPEYSREEFERIKSLPAQKIIVDPDEIRKFIRWHNLKAIFFDINPINYNPKEIKKIEVKVDSNGQKIYLVNLGSYIAVIREKGNIYEYYSL
jgi:hypothetical protein